MYEDRRCIQARDTRYIISTALACADTNIPDIMSSIERQHFMRLASFAVKFLITLKKYM